MHETTQDHIQPIDQNTKYERPFANFETLDDSFDHRIVTKDQERITAPSGPFGEFDNPYQNNPMDQVYSDVSSQKNVSLFPIQKKA